MQKILEISNYPPPACGWAIHTQMLTEELRRRGHLCQVMNINENRRARNAGFVDVQSGPDYLYKVLRFALSGYRIHMHVNAESKKGYVLALVALLVGRLTFRPAVLTFHGGLPQSRFPKPKGPSRWAFQLLFRLAGRLICNSEAVKQAIVSYGVDPQRVAAIPGFSVEYLQFEPAARLDEDVEKFLAERDPVFFCYVSFRPEYRLDVLRRAMQLFRARHPRAGFIWLGFPNKEMPAARAFVRDWPAEEAQGLLLLGNLPRERFLTLLRGSFAFLRTPACDGVSASVLESLALGVPVVASENGRRPAGVVTYREDDPADLNAKLLYLMQHAEEVRARTRLEVTDNNVSRAAQWVLGESAAPAPSMAPGRPADESSREVTPAQPTRSS